jgi:hypothetical protein
LRLNICHLIGVALVAHCSTAHATTFTFNTAPFAGIDVQNIPGRQIVGGEQFINFTPATDLFSIDPIVFGVNDTIHFVNAPVGAIPATGVNVVVLQTFDNDNNPGTPFGASQAADLIASQITTSGPGFFIYFNQSLNLPRLVFSTDLSSTNADLQILARMLNLTGATGQNAIPTFTAADFQFSPSSGVPEPSSFSLMAASVLAGISYLLRRKLRGYGSLSATE